MDGWMPFIDPQGHRILTEVGRYSLVHTSNFALNTFHSNVNYACVLALCFSVPQQDSLCCHLHYTKSISLASQSFNNQ